MKLLCSNCYEFCDDESKALSAPDPFNPGDMLRACPKCREQSLVGACDEPGCRLEAFCGTPTAAGYRRTCSKHKPKGTET